MNEMVFEFDDWQGPFWVNSVEWLHEHFNIDSHVMWDISSRYHTWLLSEYVRRFDLADANRIHRIERFLGDGFELWFGEHRVKRENCTVDSTGLKFTTSWIESSFRITMCIADDSLAVQYKLTVL